VCFGYNLGEDFGEVVFRAMKHILLVHVLKNKKKVMANNPFSKTFTKKLGNLSAAPSS
jgi:hypothetical protein